MPDGHRRICRSRAVRFQSVRCKNRHICSRNTSEYINYRLLPERCAVQRFRRKSSNKMHPNGPRPPVFLCFTVKIRAAVYIRYACEAPLSVSASRFQNYDMVENNYSLNYVSSAGNPMSVTGFKRLQFSSAALYRKSAHRRMDDFYRCSLLQLS